MSDEPVGVVIKETWTLEKFRPGADKPYEVVRVDVEGNESVQREGDD